MPRDFSQRLYFLTSDAIHHPPIHPHVKCETAVGSHSDAVKLLGLLAHKFHVTVAVQRDLWRFNIESVRLSYRKKVHPYQY